MFSVTSALYCYRVLPFALHKTGTGKFL